MEQIKVSVVIPTYNAEKFLPECLDSVINQTLRETEIICVNNGSTDNTPNILNEYQQKDKRIKIINQERSAPGNARNAGVDEAVGDYISFIDSDDYVDITYLKKLYTKAVTTDSDMTIANVYLNFMDTKKKRVFRDVAFYTFLKNKVFSANNYPELIGIIAPWDRIYKRRFLLENDIRNPENIIYEDRFLAVDVCIHAKRITVVNEPLYYYRKNSGNAITDLEQRSKRQMLDFLTITKKSMDLIKEHDLFDVFAYEYLRSHFDHGINHHVNTININMFEDFFQKMCDLMTEEDFKVANTIYDERIKEYVKHLEYNDIKNCRKYLQKYLVETSA